MMRSIVVATRNNLGEIRTCLEALTPQVRDDVEVLVADASRDGSAELVERTFPWVHLLRAPCQTGLAELRAAALTASRGAVVAFTDVCCRAGEGWVERLRQEPWHAYAAVGGAVVPAPQLSLADWAATFVEYGPYLPPFPAGEASHLPGNNVAFRRDALERAGLVGEPEFWKVFALGRLAARGERCWSDPELVVRHGRSTPARRWAYLRYLHGRCFAANRVATLPRAQRLARLARLASCPAVPLLLTARLVRAVHPKRAYRGHLWRSLPLALAFHAAWAWGELDGYVHGRGDACARLV